jgi:hypothetical protein
MEFNIKVTEIRNSNGWKQVARVEMDMSLAGDSTTPARAKAALLALDAAYRKVKAELKAMAEGST